MLQSKANSKTYLALKGGQKKRAPEWPPHVALSRILNARGKDRKNDSLWDELA